MIHSMTAFARRERRGEWGMAAWELRSVNHRYLEASVRLPETLRDLEPLVRDELRRGLQRGKVECSLRLQLEAAEGGEFTLDRELAARLAHSSREVDALLYSPAPVNSMDILRWPGVLKTEEMDLSTVREAVMELLKEAIGELCSTRQREGAQLRRVIEERLKAAVAEVTEVKVRMPEVLATQRERLRARLAELEVELDAGRLEQELVLFAQRVDVDEEMDRLTTHLAEVGRILERGGAVGRRLDFLMQEMNREANTLGSKSQDSATTKSSVELKVLIEQMREQVQNIE